MSLKLTDHDRAALSGSLGPGIRLAMSIVVQMAEIQGAKELLTLSSAHIDSTIYIGEANLEFAERLAVLGAKVAVPATLNVSGLDEHHWTEWPVPQEWAHKAHRQMKAYESMGCHPTWTCTPYQSGLRPRFGQQVAWGESSAVVFANSVIGARTERYPDLLDICCAITGRAPAVGLHLSQNRAGHILIRLEEIPKSLQVEDAFYSVLGHLVGKVAMDRIPVIEGLAVRPSEDQLKALGAAAASSGAVALFHIPGVTPEAPDTDAAFQGRSPSRITAVSMDDLRQSRKDLTSPGVDHLDMVVLGCPHFSVAEFRQLSDLIKGRRAHRDVRFLVTTSRSVRHQAEKSGYLEALLAFGGRVTVDTCILATPMVPQEITTIMTSSAKCAFYSPAMLKRKVVFGSMKECVDSAVEGHIVEDRRLWE